MTERKPRFVRLAAGLLALVALGSGVVFGPVVAASQGASGGVTPAVRTPDTRQPPSPGMGRSNQDPTRWEWWNDADVQKELALSADKVKQIDEFYQRRVKDLKPVVDEFMKQFKELDAMTKAAVVDEPIYSMQVLRVESLRSRLNESRTMMLYRIYRTLQPDQYKKLQDIFDRRARMAGSTPPGRGRE